MNERQLIAQLNNLKSVNPEAAWLNSNREILLAQISNSGAAKLSVWTRFMIDTRSLARTISRPAFALGSFMLFLLGASLFGHQLFNRVKPNDSLYIARVISEKARLNTIFNTDERDKMAVQFANERAKDIVTVLNNPNFSQADDKATMDRLNQDFSQEINTVKDRIGRLPAAPLTPAAPLVATKPTLSSETAGDDAQVFSADSTKDVQGVQVVQNENIVAPVIAPGTIIDEAKKSFDSKDYGSTLDKLKEVDSIIKK